jgi:K(+)-stimulated pyrophosphate-energized sodium pump
MDAGLISIITGAVGIFFAAILSLRILKLPTGEKRMQEIAGYIQEGANAYLKRQTKTMAAFAIVIFILIGFFCT